jgi:tetratricopeptide (TPR) repeat protein
VRRLLLVAGVLLLAACQQAPSGPAPSSGAVSPAAQLRGEGDAFTAKGDHARALEKYRQAADLEPNSVPLHFALGSAYSFLDKRAEAIAQFRWVIANASAGSTEHDEARRWLVRVGAFVEPAARASEPAPSDASAKASPESVEAKVDPSATGSISGRTQWSNLSQPVKVSLILVGDEAATRDVKRRAGIALGESYEFKDIPQGKYRVVATYLEDTILWDQPVAVQAGRPTELVLTQADSRLPSEEFRDPR